MLRKCPTCGSEVDASASVCPVCGLEMSMPVSDGQISGILFIRRFAIISIISGIIGIITAVSGFGFSSIIPVSGGSVSTSVSAFINSSEFVYFLILIATITVVAMFSYYMLYRGFNALSKSSVRFASPRTGSLLLMAGFAMVILPAVAIILMVPNLLSGISASSLSGPFLTKLLLVSSVLLLGVVLLLIGIIMGVIIGMHRLALAFNTGMFDAAMIMYLISFIFTPIILIAAVLVLAGCNESLRKIKGGSIQQSAR
jgi:hypothetical protein